MSRVTAEGNETKRKAVRNWTVFLGRQIYTASNQTSNHFTFPGYKGVPVYLNALFIEQYIVSQVIKQQQQQQQ